MIDRSIPSSEPAGKIHWNADEQSLLVASMAATPTQRLAWLEEALHVAYASGALKPRTLISQEEWEAMGSTSR